MFYGSTSYVLQHIFGLKRIKSVINVDMIGYDHDSDGLTNIPYGEDSIKEVVSGEYNRLGLAINPVFLSMDVLLNQSEHTFLPSDHFAFDTFGVDAVVSFDEGWWLSETEFGDNESNIAYHTEDDTVDNINFPYMTEIVKLYVATLAREAGVIGKR
jgi:Zn-dependent M28 family amino/carboxypeptidase